MFSSTSFRVPGLTVRSLIHFELLGLYLGACKFEIFHSLYLVQLFCLLALLSRNCLICTDFSLCHDFLLVVLFSSGAYASLAFGPLYIRISLAHRLAWVQRQDFEPSLFRLLFSYSVSGDPQEFPYLFTHMPGYLGGRHYGLLQSRLSWLRAAIFSTIFRALFLVAEPDPFSWEVLLLSIFAVYHYALGIFAATVDNGDLPWPPGYFCISRLVVCLFQMLGCEVLSGTHQFSLMLGPWQCTLCCKLRRGIAAFLLLLIALVLRTYSMFV